MEKRLSKWHSYIEGDSAKIDVADTKNKVNTSTKTPADELAASNASLNSAAENVDSAVQGANKNSVVQDVSKSSSETEAV